MCWSHQWAPILSYTQTHKTHRHRITEPHRHRITYTQNHTDNSQTLGKPLWALSGPFLCLGTNFVTHRIEYRQRDRQTKDRERQIHRDTHNPRTISILKLLWALPLFRDPFRVNQQPEVLVGKRRGRATPRARVARPM